MLFEHSTQFGKADFAQGTAVAPGCQDGSGQPPRVEKGLNASDGFQGGSADFMGESDGATFLGFDVENEALGNAEMEHFLQAESLGAELDVVIFPGSGRPGFVFHGPSFEEGLAFAADFDEIGLAGEPERIGKDRKRPEQNPTRTGFKAGEIGMGVVESAKKGVVIFFEDTLNVNKRGSTWAEEELIQSGEREVIPLSVCLVQNWNLRRHINLGVRR